MSATIIEKGGRYGAQRAIGCLAMAVRCATDNFHTRARPPLRPIARSVVRMASVSSVISPMAILATVPATSDDRCRSCGPRGMKNFFLVDNSVTPASIYQH